MEIVIEQSVLEKERLSYQEEIPFVVKCRKCKHEARLLMQVHDDKQILVDERPENVKVWPHDASVTNVYLCTECGSMRAMWNQG